MSLVRMPTVRGILSNSEESENQSIGTPWIYKSLPPSHPTKSTYLRSNRELYLNQFWKRLLLRNEGPCMRGRVTFSQAWAEVGAIDGSDHTQILCLNYVDAKKFRKGASDNG